MTLFSIILSTPKKLIYILFFLMNTLDKHKILKPIKRKEKILKTWRFINQLFMGVGQFKQL